MAMAYSALARTRTRAVGGDVRGDDRLIAGDERGRTPIELDDLAADTAHPLALGLVDQ
jgi:hypothetical protein